MTINSQADLRAALAAAKGGDTIELGDIVGPVALGPLSFDPPVILKGGSLSLIGTPAEYTQLLWLNKVRGLALDGVAFRGAGERGGQLGWGIRADDCAELTIMHCDLTMLMRGVLLTRCTNTAVNDNRFYALRSDGVDVVQCTGFEVYGNVFDDFTPAPGDHPDGVQLWTTGTKSGSRQGVISENRIIGRPGQFPQGIFIRDELALYKTGAGHADIEISYNSIVGSAWHGITVQDPVDGLRVLNNEVFGTTGALINGQQVTPWINLPADAAASGNTAPRYLIGGKDGASAGNTVDAYVTQADADALIDAMLAAAAPKPEPDPNPTPPVVDPVPDPVPAPVAPAPTVDLVALLAIATDARDQINQAENALGRALYRQDKMISAIKGMIG